MTLKLKEVLENPEKAIDDYDDLTKQSRVINISLNFGSSTIPKSPMYLPGNDRNMCLTRQWGNLEDLDDAEQEMHSMITSFFNSVREQELGEALRGLRNTTTYNDSTDTINTDCKCMEKSTCAPLDATKKVAYDIEPGDIIAQTDIVPKFMFVSNISAHSDDKLKLMAKKNSVEYFELLNKIDVVELDDNSMEAAALRAYIRRQNLTEGLA